MIRYSSLIHFIGLHFRDSAAVKKIWLEVVDSNTSLTSDLETPRDPLWLMELESKNISDKNTNEN